MNNPKPTVYLQDLPNYHHAVRMVWGRTPALSDIDAAFADLLARLEASDDLLHVLVDVSSKPSFPLNTTLGGAIHVQKHPRLGRWIVVGANAMSKFIGASIMMIGKNNIDWCETEAQAMRVLDDLMTD